MTASGVLLWGHQQQLCRDNNICRCVSCMLADDQLHLHSICHSAVCLELVAAAAHVSIRLLCPVSVVIS